MEEVLNDTPTMIGLCVVAAAWVFVLWLRWHFRPPPKP